MVGLLTDEDITQLELHGPRLALRRWRAEDAERVHEVMQHRSMFDFLRLPDPYTVQDASAFVTSRGHDGRDSGDGIGSAVVERHSGRVVGSASLRASGHLPEVGYWIAPDARGRGYAAEATNLLTGAGFDFGLPRVTLLCDVRNVASIRTALRAGFRHEGTLRDGAPSGALGAADLACFGRTADDAGTPIEAAFPPLPPEGLTDGVIVVRPLTPDDAEELHESSDDLAAHFGFGGERRTARDDRRLADSGALDLLVGHSAHLAIADRATGGFAGDLSVRRFGPPAVWLLGYTIHPLFRGRGYTTRALRLLTPWAFEHGVHRLELGAKVANVASQRAALGAGFQDEGRYRGRLRNPDGSFSDEQRFALLAPPDVSGGAGS